MTVADVVGLTDLDPVALSQAAAHARRAAAWRSACERLGFNGGPEYDPERALRYSTFLLSGAGSWMMSRASGVAVTVVSPSRVKFERQSQIRENERRDSMTPRVCELVAWALVNSIDWHVQQTHEAMKTPYEIATLVADASFPGYTFIRNYLVHECDARYVLACATAHRATATFNRYRRLIGPLAKDIRRSASEERGWL